MLAYVKPEAVEEYWEMWEAALGRHWNATINFETLDNLKEKLVNRDCFLWVCQLPDYKFVFVSEARKTATAKIFHITHCGSLNQNSKRWGKKKIQQVLKDVFKEIEEYAAELEFDIVSVSARPAHVAMADDYKVQTTTIVKQIR